MYTKGSEIYFVLSVQIFIKRCITVSGCVFNEMFCFSGSAFTELDNPLLDLSEDAQMTNRWGSAPVTGPGGASSQAWVDSMYTGSMRVMETMETLYNRTAHATGILPALSQ